MMPTLEYASSPLRRPRNWRTIIRAVTIGVAAILSGWSLLMRSYLIVSNHGLPVTNEWFAVRALVDDPTSRDEFRDWHIRSFAGFHFVNWADWHRDGYYVLIPKWAMILMTGTIFVLSIALTGAAVRKKTRPKKTAPASCPPAPR